MVTGIILVNVERAKIADVIEGIIKIDGVSEVYTVAGEYDIAVIVRVRTNAELSGDILAQSEFKDGTYCTNFLEKFLKDYR